MLLVVCTTDLVSLTGSVRYWLYVVDNLEKMVVHYTAKINERLLHRTLYWKLELSEKSAYKDYRYSYQQYRWRH